MKPSRFRYERPASVAEAAALLAEPGAYARPLAGGQSFVPLMNLRLAAPDVVVDLGGIAGLDGIEVADGHLRVGALARQRALERSPAAAAACPLLRDCLRYVGHVATRNRGTVGGSLAHADPAAELPLVLATLGGEVTVEGVRGRRAIAAADLFVTHLTSSLEPDEVLVEARFPSTAGWGTAFDEVAPRHGDYAFAMAACALRVEDGAVVEARVGAGAAADRPLRLAAAEEALLGAALGGERARAAGAAAAAACDPVDGLHAPAAYRRSLVETLVRRVVERAYAEAAA